MTATDELRRLLDGRGVEWIGTSFSTPAKGHPTNTSLGEEHHEATFIEYDDGNVLRLFDLTPAQAVEATLGRMDKVYAVGGIIAQAECSDVCSSASEFTCSACGFNCDLTSWISLFDGDDGRHRHHHHGTPNYCPNCGRKVVDA